MQVNEDWLFSGFCDQKYKEKYQESNITVMKLHLLTSEKKWLVVVPVCKVQQSSLLRHEGYEL